MKLKLTGIFLILVLVLSACSLNQQDGPIIEPPIEPVTGGEITVGTNLNYLTLDPLSYKVSTNEIYAIDSIIYRGLYKYDSNLKLTSDLAENSLKIDKEANTISFKLKNNLKFDNGTPLTIDDVLFTLELYSKGEYNGNWKQYTYNIQGADVYRIGEADIITGIITSPDDNSITIQYNQLDVNDLQLLTAPILSKKQLEGMNISEIREINKNGELNSTGPFKLTSRTDNEWILARNAYYEETVYLDKISFKNYDSNNYYDLTFGLPQDTENIEGKKIVTLAGQGYQYLGMNLNLDEFKDSNLREAISLGLDYQAIIDKVYFNYADKPLSLIHPKSWLYEPVEIQNTNIEKAKTLINGRNLSFELAYEDSPFYAELAKEIKAQLAQIGINTQLKPIVREKYQSSLFFKGEYDMFISSWQYEIDPIFENKKWLAKDDVLLGGYNVSHVNDEIIDNFLINGKKELNEVKRYGIYSEWQGHFMNQHYIIQLASPQMILIANENLNFEISNSLVPYLDIHNWWLKPVEQTELQY